MKTWDDMDATRISLLDRVRDLDDDPSWIEFYEFYSPVIHGYALRTGLTEPEAGDAVLETMITIAKKMPQFRYDPAKGRFRHRVAKITAWRIADQFRKRYPSNVISLDEEKKRNPGLLAQFKKGTTAWWDEAWDDEIWAKAVERVKKRVSATTWNVFELFVLKGRPAKEAAKSLGISQARVYWAHHRVKLLLGQEIEYIQKGGPLRDL
jgi:RNA polymerase sigma factor (sigma-70 family)